MSEVLYSADELEKVVADLAAAVAADYSGRPLLLLGLLKGCQPFLADLCRQLSRYRMELELDYLQVSSYVGTSSSGRVTIKPLNTDDSFFRQRHVLVVDDIFDTGLTLKEVTAWLKEKGAASVKSCVMLRKSGCSNVVLTPDYCGATIPDAFVVGYGLDYNEQYRELPYIEILGADES